MKLLSNNGIRVVNTSEEYISKARARITHLAGNPGPDWVGAGVGTNGGLCIAVKRCQNFHRTTNQPTNALERSSMVVVEPLGACRIVKGSAKDEARRHSTYLGLQAGYYATLQHATPLCYRHQCLRLANGRMLCNRDASRDLNVAVCEYVVMLVYHTAKI